MAAKLKILAEGVARPGKGLVGLPSVSIGWSGLSIARHGGQQRCRWATRRLREVHGELDLEQLMDPGGGCSQDHQVRACQAASASSCPVVPVSKAIRGRRESLPCAGILQLSKPQRRCWWAPSKASVAEGGVREAEERRVEQEQREADGTEQVLAQVAAASTRSGRLDRAVSAARH